MKVTKLSLALLAVCLAGATSANAGLTVVPDGVNPGQVINLTVSGDVPYYSGGAWAGVYNNIVNGVFTPGFCIDVARESGSESDYSYTTLSSSPLTPAGPMGTAAATIVEQLWYTYFSAAESDVTGATAAALQVAIWDTVAIGAGNHYSIVVDPGLQSAALTMLAGSASSPTADLIGLTSSDGQNYVVAVPEPTTIISGMLMLLPFGASTLRILRKNRAA
jgi:hypothetical protein